MPVRRSFSVGGVELEKEGIEERSSLHKTSIFAIILRNCRDQGGPHGQAKRQFPSAPLPGAVELSRVKAAPWG